MHAVDVKSLMLELILMMRICRSEFLLTNFAIYLCCLPLKGTVVEIAQCSSLLKACIMALPMIFPAFSADSTMCTSE